jgi:hypothetical protein
VELPLHIVEDLDVIVQRSRFDVTEPGERRVSGWNAGRLELGCWPHLIVHAATLSDVRPGVR